MKCNLKSINNKIIIDYLGSDSNLPENKPEEKIENEKADELQISVYNYVLADIKGHKLRYGLAIFGMIVCVVFFLEHFF